VVSLSGDDLVETVRFTVAGWWRFKRWSILGRQPTTRLGVAHEGLAGGDRKPSKSAEGVPGCVLRLVQKLII
jgi:hypothetical protein